MRERGVTMDQLAQQMGCTHATLSQWQHSHTNIENPKVGLLSAFCKVTGTSLAWILTGDGPRIDSYNGSALVSRLAGTLSVMERQDPEGLALLARMIDAAGQQQ